MKNLILTLIVAFATTVIQASLVIENVTQSEFDAVFNSSENLWYAQYQPGGQSGQDSHEVEVGDFSNMPDETGEYSWLNDQDNPFEISMSGGNTLTAEVNGSSAGAGFGVTEPFNVIWVGLHFNEGGPSDEVMVSHTFDGTPLPDMHLTSHPDFYGFKFYDTERRSNIGEFSHLGDIHPVAEIAFIGDDYTVTSTGTYDPSVVPEPNTLYLVLVALGALLFYKQAKPSH